MMFLDIKSWITLLLFLSMTRAIKWLSLASLGTALIGEDADGKSFCSNIQGLERRQKKVCRQHVDMMQSVMAGAKIAVEECQYQFMKRRWNCSVIDPNSIFTTKITEGTREAAYVHAIASAGVSYAVTRGCSRGELPECGCDRSRKGDAGSFEWAGCSDNVLFGSAFSKRFTDARERLKRSNGRSLMNLHNNQAGRTLLESHMQMECKCHGVSGSCELKTCWRSMPSFRKVGTILKDSYDGATQVKSKSTDGNRVKLFQRTNQNYKPYSLQDLVYLRSSPDFCVKNEKEGSQGTQGRECNRTSKGLDGCDLMCCGRGYHTVVEDVVDRCNCKFHWCCHVECDECTRKVERNICL